VLTPLAQRVLDFTPFKIFNCCKVRTSPRVEVHDFLRSVKSGKKMLQPIISAYEQGAIIREAKLTSTPTNKCMS
jgi:hypothetical protein